MIGGRISRGLLPARFLVLAALGLLACGEPLPVLAPVPVPDTQQHERAVQQALATAFADVERARAAPRGPVPLAQAYGDLAMTCHAQQFIACAEGAYRNARELAPRELRWPYLLAHLYADGARLPDAQAAFDAALALDGNDAPTLFSLGELLLKRGDFERARVLFEQLKDRPDGRAAALAGLGRAAMARHDARAAIGHFEEALRLWPSATRLQHPLAMAYRALGDETQAEAALRAYSPRSDEPAPPDPAVDAMGAKVASSRGLLRRGQRYSNAQRFDLALPVYQAAAHANPLDAEVLANLGIALANLARLDEAKTALRESLQRADADAHVHFALATVYDRQGLDDLGTAAYEAALRIEPAHAQALLHLADLHMRAGRFDAAAQRYRQALQTAPSTRVRISLALAALRLGRDRDARAELERGVAAEPDHAGAVNALARLLATSTDAGVRDGRRALTLARALRERTNSAEVGQTFAMALAETGDFNGALEVQQQVIAALARGGVTLPFLQANLVRYAQRQPARAAWPADDPIFKPRSPALARG